MKEKLMVFLVAYVLLSTAVAQEFENAGITPDSFLYVFDKLAEKARLMFTFDKIEKAKLKIKYAEERLAEAAVMVQVGKPEKAKELVDEYGRDISEVEDGIDVAEKEGRNVTRVLEIVSEATSKHFEVLQRVLEKAPEPAKEHILNAINASSKGRDRALASIGKGIQKEEQKQNQTQEREQRIENDTKPPSGNLIGVVIPGQEKEKNKKDETKSRKGT